jgi:hypothetical protein
MGCFSVWALFSPRETIVHFVTYYLDSNFSCSILHVRLGASLMIRFLDCWYLCLEDQENYIVRVILIILSKAGWWLLQSLRNHVPWKRLCILDRVGGNYRPGAACDMLLEWGVITMYSDLLYNGSHWWKLWSQWDGSKVEETRDAVIVMPLQLSVMRVRMWEISSPNIFFGCIKF